jgi:transcriptional regulator with XRE-family HTH domain
MERTEKIAAIEVLKDIMAKHEVTVTQLAERLGKSRSAVSNKVTGIQKTITTDKLDELLDALGYEITVVPKGTKLPKGGYRVD